MNIVTENWDKILLNLKEEYDVTDVPYKTWLLPLKVYSVEDQVVTILIPKKLSGMGLNYISSKYGLPLQVTISVVTGMEDCEVRFITEDEIIKTSSPATRPSAEHTGSDIILNDRYTFETFVVGPNSQFAQAASLAVASSPGKIYNPLFLYGGPGLGKTHLMQSIAHYILENNPDMKVLYVTSEKFTIELIDAIRNGSSSTISNFRNKYRNIDVLLIDDIQFIIGKESTQEEFFHTFNHLHEAGKQIIISSDKPPKDMITLEERLRTRFAWGLIADITLPDYETRMAILHKKEELDHCNVSEEVIRYIAENIKSNIRELEGALNKVVAKAKLENKETNLELAEQVLNDIITPHEKGTVTSDKIFSVITDYYHISMEDLEGPKRNNKIAIPRQICMYLSREYLGISFAAIGLLLGNRDHSTVMHGIEKVENEIKENEVTRTVITQLRKKISPQT